MPEYIALSVIAPHGTSIAAGRKSIEVRSWQPLVLPLQDLLVVENEIYLTQEGQVDPDGRAVALVDIRIVEPWLPSQVEAACSRGWEPGYFAWHLENVRPLNPSARVPAERKLYKVELQNAEIGA